MNITVEIPASMLRHAGGDTRVHSFIAATIDEALQRLTVRFPKLRAQLFSVDGRLYGFVGVFVNSTDIRRLDGIQTPLADGDEITIVPAIAGG